jgi:hypothetical protein
MLLASTVSSNAGRVYATDNVGIFSLPFKQSYAPTEPNWGTEEKKEGEKKFVTDDGHPDVNVRPVRVGAGPNIEFVDRDQAAKDAAKEKEAAEKQ